MSVVRGFLAEVRILPMSLMLLMCLLGGLFAAGPLLNWSIMGLVLVNAFCFLYAAHLNDTYWDIRRGEYEDGRRLHSVRFRENGYLPRWGFGYEIPNAPILPKGYYLAGLALSAAIGISVMIYISTIIGWFYSALAIVGLLLALTYSAGLDKIPALGDAMWEVGVLFALFCGYYSQALKLDDSIIKIAIALLFGLFSAKMMDSLPDTICDLHHNPPKMTFTVFLYKRGWPLSRIRHLSFIPLYICMLLFIALTPLPIKVGASITLIAFILDHILLRGDIEGRKTIVVAGFILIFFMVWNIICILMRLI